MTLYSLAPLVSSVLFLLLCFFVGQHRFKSLNLTYAFFTFLTAWWQGSWAILFNISDPKLADFIVRLGYSGITFLPVAYYHFVVELLKLKDRRKLVLLSYAIGMVFLLLLWNSNLYINGFYEYSWGYYPKAGPLHPIYLIFLNILAFQGFYLPYKFSKQSEDHKRQLKQHWFVFLSNLIYCFAATDFLTNYGIAIYPMGFAPILISAGIFCYAIYKVQLMDIRLVLRSWMIYLLFGAVVSYPLMAAANVLKDRVNPMFLIPFIVILSPFLYNKMKNPISSLVDKFKAFDQYKRRKEEMDAWADMIFEGKTVYQCANKLAQILNKRFNPKKVGIYVQETEKGKIDYNPIALDGKFEGVDLYVPISDEESGLLKKGKILILEELKNYWTSQAEQKAGFSMDGKKYEIYYPIMENKNLIAVIGLGEKNKGAYSDLDFGDIAILAQLFDSALRGLMFQKKMQQFTSMWAHDLNTPFSKGNVMGFLKMAINEKFGAITDELKDTLIHVYDCLVFPAENIQKLFMPDASFKKQSLDFTEQSLAQSFNNVKRYNRGALAEKQVEIVLNLPPEDLVFKYDKMIIERRVIGNIVSNAIRHTPEEGAVSLSYKLEEKNALISIHNTGSFIPEDKREKIFGAGEQSEGGGDAGLGLYIVRQLVEDHGGKVWVESDEKEGTTFYFTLPLER